MLDTDDVRDKRCRAFSETLQCGSIISVPAHVSGLLECMDDCLASPFHKVFRGQVQQPLRQIAVCFEDDVDVPLAGDLELAAEQQLPNCDQLLFVKVLKIGAGTSKTLQVMLAETFSCDCNSPPCC